MQQVSILGIPYDAMSSHLRGPAEGPKAIREQLHGGSANYFTEQGLDLITISDQWTDLGNLEFDTEDPLPVFEKITAAVDKELAAGRKVLSLGGDHSIAYPIIRAYAKHYESLNILQIDAHADLYHDFEGNPYSHACPFARIMEQQLASHLTQVGIRTLNTHQREQAQKFGVEIIEMKDFKNGQTLDLKGPLYISIDLDGFDPAFAPGVSHHEPGGLSTRAVLNLLQQIQVPIVGMDIVELNPTRDWHGMTAMLAAKLLRESLGLLLKP